MSKRKEAAQEGPWELLAHEVTWLVEKLEEMRPHHVVVVVDGTDAAALVWRPEALQTQAAGWYPTPGESALLGLFHAAALNHPEPLKSVEVHGVWPEESKRVRLVVVRPVGAERGGPPDYWAHA